MRLQNNLTEVSANEIFHNDELDGRDGGIMNIGELRAYNYLQANGWTVEDVTSNEAYFDKDIDLIARSGTESLTVEVKWDNRIGQTGNMFIETVTDLDKSKAGWFLFCQADYIYYGDSVNQLFYVFKTQDLRDFVATHYTQERKAADYNYRGLLKKVSQGMLVPIKEFSQCYDVQIVLLDKWDQSYTRKKRGYYTK